MSSRAVLAVLPGTALDDARRLAGALAQALPVDLIAHEDGAPCDGVLVIGDAAVPDDGRWALVLLDADGSGVSDAAVAIGDDTRVPRLLRGITLSRQERAAPLTPGEDEDVLATTRDGGAAAWTASRDGRVQRVAAALPVLGDDDGLRDALHSGRGLALVALVTLARRIAGVQEDRRPIRASVIFDDPNLRHPTYGFIRYAELIAHADAHDYHASMAMIPLDTWRPSAKAIELFRDRPDRLSLSFHGNNHEKRELLQPATLPPALALCASALRRMERFEARTGLAVDRVMIPPHGMCSPSTARALGALGFDALCAIHPLPWTERPPADRPLAGWEPATFAEGCAVIPRIPFSWDATGVALHAFLGHPIVFYGHHDDLAAGLESLEHAAAAVNRLGAVQWCSLARLATANRAIAEEDARVIVYPHANRVTVELPTEATELVVAPPSGSAADLLSWSLAGRRAPLGEALPVTGGVTAEIRLHGVAEVAPADVTPQAPRPWPALRRTGTELRDRLAPLRR